MPCYDDRNSVDYQRKEWLHNSPVAQMLCEVCTLLEMKGEIAGLSAETKQWWEDHQLRDMKRTGGAA